MVKGLLVSAALAFSIPLHALTVSVEDSSLDFGNAVWSQRELGDGTAELTLEAQAAAGYVFSGWTVEGNEGGEPWPADPRYGERLTAIVSTNATITASFVYCGEDSLAFELADALPEAVECREEMSLALDIDSVSFPSLKFSGLPKGLSYDRRTLTLAGKPTEPGIYNIEATGVNASGFTFWGSAEMRVGNLSGNRLFGTDEEIALDEYYHVEFEDLFTCQGEVESVTLTGAPSGLTWDEDWQLLYGTPTEPGDYTLKARVVFATGLSETATMVLSVVAPDPSEYGVELEMLDTVQVADVLVAEDCEIGTDANGDGIVSVKGLPTGLSTMRWREDGVRHWALEGRLTKAGQYRVWVSVADHSDVTQRVVRTSRLVTVSDTPQQYFSVTSSDAAAGSVSGGGAVTPGLPVVVSATPAAGQVFAGWVDDIGERQVLNEGVDYRTPSVTLPAETDYSFLTLVATFVSAAEDVAPDLSDLDGAAYYLVGGQEFSQSFAVVSASLPKLTFRNLPDGVVCNPSGGGEFVLTYDGEATADQPPPGRYAVTATAENRSGRKTTAQFRFTVQNLSDPRIAVDDNYGEVAPGAPIEPIDLSDAVDFGRGETLTVTDLPKGLTYNSRSDAKKGIAAHTITGTPTMPGDYTLTFTARVVSSVTTNSSGRVTTEYETAKATAFLTVLPYPELAIELDDEAAAAGCKVKGGGNYKVGTKVTLQAIAAKGWVFTGWEGLDEVDALQALKPSLSHVSGSEGLEVRANFAPIAADYLYLGEPAMSESGFAAELEYGVAIDEQGMETLVYDLIDSGSWPTVKVTGLPGDIKFSASTFLLSGTPKKSGVYHVTVTAKNAGGYSFVRTFDLAVRKKDGELPEEVLVNAADIDFGQWTGLVTGVRCPSPGPVAVVPPNPDIGAAVKKVTVGGLPTGLKAVVSLTEDGGAELELAGLPTKPGRFLVTVTVAYVTGKSAKSQRAVVVTDGGSSYLYVEPATDGGTVTGSGVYAAGETVKLTAKPAKNYVFAGWTRSDGSPLELDGVDYRTQSVSFPCWAADSESDNVVYGNFVPSDEDRRIELAFTTAVWTIQPDVASEFAYSLTSASLPKISAKGLPKGVSLDAVRGVLVYEPTSAVVSGIYAAELSVRNSTISKVQVFGLEIHVANRESEVISGLDPAMDAYQLPIGVAVAADRISAQVDEGWTLTVNGLPSGLSYKNGVITGAPLKAGNYTVTFTATIGKGKAKRTEVATIVVAVSPLPSSAVGTFNGFLENDEGNMVGTISVSATAAGKVSASVKLPAKTLKYSAKSWDSYDSANVYLAVAGKDGSELQLAVDYLSGWPNWQMAGEIEVNGEIYQFDGQHAPSATTISGTYSAMGWTVKVAKSGSVTVAGKVDGKKVSGSTTLMCDDEGYFAEIVTFPNKNTALNVHIRLGDEGGITDISTEAVIVP